MTLKYNEVAPIFRRRRSWPLRSRIQLQTVCSSGGLGSPDVGIGGGVKKLYARLRICVDKDSLSVLGPSDNVPRNKGVVMEKAVLGVTIG